MKGLEAPILHFHPIEKGQQLPPLTMLGIYVPITPTPTKTKPIKVGMCVHRSDVYNCRLTLFRIREVVVQARMSQNRKR